MFTDKSAIANINYNHEGYFSQYYLTLLLAEYKCDVDYDSFHFEGSYDIKEFKEYILSAFKDMNAEYKYSPLYSSSTNLLINIPGRLIIDITYSSRDDNRFDIYGTEEYVVAAKSHITEFFKDKTEDIYLKWIMSMNNSLTEIPLVMDKVSDIKQEAYPYIPDIFNYFENFKKSKSNVIIFLGPPGTGKTTLTKWLISNYQYNTSVVYDEDVMYKDQLYIDFITDSRRNLMVLEDSDKILTERIKDNNKTMSKILNVSDGLVSIKNKKFLFTANIRHKDDIDEALMRPGRCYDVIEFRNLNQEEAGKLATVIDSNIQLDKESYSIAEIYNERKSITKIKQKVGFLR